MTSQAEKDARKYGHNHPLNFSITLEEEHDQCFLAGARALLEWAKSKQFDVINSDSPVVGIWELEAFFEEQAK